MSATAREVVERFGYDARLEAVNQRFGGVDSHLTPSGARSAGASSPTRRPGETAFGIAISENLSFTGAEQTENGLTYYELSPGQTLGLYTATGWQFWINGSKKGWFDSADGMLHAGNLQVEQLLQLGADWVLSTAGGFGLRYLGGPGG